MPEPGPQLGPRGHRPGAHRDRQALLLVVHAEAVVEPPADLTRPEEARNAGQLPPDEQEPVTAAVAWVLGTYPQVTGLATAGETRLLRAMLAAERASGELTPEQAARVLDGVEDYASPFVSMPF